MEPKDLAYEIARVIDERKGHDIVLLDLRGISDITEFFLVATGDNARMVDGIVDEVENRLRPHGVRALAVEGREDNTWDLMDFGSLIVHVFQPEARAYYRLERLWGDAPRIEFEEGLPVSQEPTGSDRQSPDSESADADALDAAEAAAAVAEGLIAD